VEVDLDPADELSVEGLFRFVRVGEPFAPIGTADEDQLRLKARYRPTEEFSISAFFTRRYTTNEMHDTDILSWATGITLSYEPVEDLTLEGTYDYQDYETETDVVRFLNGDLVPGRSEYEGRTHGVTLFFGWDVTAELKLFGGLSWYTTSGDFETDLLDMKLGGEYRFSKQVAAGFDLRYTTYDEDDASLDDYDAFSVDLWLRLGF
jgi:predicted porin